MEAKREIRGSVKIRQEFLPLRLEKPFQPLSGKSKFLRVLDLILLNLAIALGWIDTFADLRSETRIVTIAAITILVNLFWFLFAEAFNAYRIQALGQVRHSVISALSATITLILIISIFMILRPTHFDDFLISVLSALFLLSVGRVIYRKKLARTLPKKILYIGNQEGLRILQDSTSEAKNNNYEVLGSIDVDSDLSVLDENLPPQLGSINDLSSIAKKYLPDFIVLSTDRQWAEIDQMEFAKSIEAGIEIIPLPDFVAELSGRFPIYDSSIEWISSILIHHPGKNTAYRVVKRILDLILASLGLFFLAIMFPFIAVAIYLDSPGQILYKQARVGKDGKVFRVYKFRSMIPNAEARSAIWASVNDDRITRVGRIIRKTHIDEFPQFINILKGEMSAVGPRPERPEFVEGLEEEIPLYRIRHVVKPGMAGWGLINQGYVSSLEDTKKKLEYDLYYIKNQSLWFDLVILAKTFKDTFTLRGR